jgi:hypothetical protein
MKGTAAFVLSAPTQQSALYQLDDNWTIGAALKGSRSESNEQWGGGNKQPQRSVTGFSQPSIAVQKS